MVCHRLYKYMGYRIADANLQTRMFGYNTYMHIYRKYLPTDNFACILLVLHIYLIICETYVSIVYILYIILYNIYSYLQSPPTLNFDFKEHSNFHFFCCPSHSAEIFKLYPELWYAILWMYTFG